MIRLQQLVSMYSFSYQEMFYGRYTPLMNIKLKLGLGLGLGLGQGGEPD